MSKKLTIESYEDYSALAHAIMRTAISGGRSLPNTGSGMLAFIAAAQGFKSSQAFKAALCTPKPQGKALEPAKSASLASVITTAYRNDITAFFYSGSSASWQVRQSLFEMISGVGPIRGYDFTGWALQNGFEEFFIENDLRVPASKDLIDSVIAVYGNEAYDQLRKSRSDFDKMKFNEGVLFRVGDLAWKYGFRITLINFMMLLGFELQHTSFRKAIRADMELSVDQNDPLLMLESTTFKTKFNGLLEQVDFIAALD
mgnify:CR=1 FL=1